MRRGSKAAVLADYAVGMGYTKVAQKHGIPRSKVCRWVGEAGIGRTVRNGSTTGKHKSPSILSKRDGSWVLGPKRVMVWQVGAR